MKLIESIFLRFKEGSSDKEYKAEIFESSADNYIVNFAFGKSGSTLKENSKTTVPVSLEEAKKLFNSIVNEKIKKGYKKIRSFSIDKTDKVASSYDPQKQKEKILEKISFEYIAKIALTDKLNQAKKNKLVSRAVWRAGELKIKEATPQLLSLLNSEDIMMKYSVIWSLGYCGDQSISEKLEEIFQDAKNPEMIKRIAQEAFLKVTDEDSKNRLIDKKIETLPNHLKELLASKKYNDFNNAVNLFIFKAENVQKILETLYYIDEQPVRENLINILKNIPLKAPNFKSLRHIFKMAEYRRDAEVYGVIARRFEKETPTLNNKNVYSWDSDWAYIMTEHGYLRASDVKKEIKTEKSRFAFTQRTKEYMIARVIRDLRKMGEDKQEEFVKMAVGTLLAYNDTDAVLAKETSKSFYNYQTYRSYTKKSTWDKYAPYLALNFLLYSNSQRYDREEGSRAWKCINNYMPGDPEPEAREEAFPEMWNKYPAGLVHLLVESNCKPVHHFAVKALHDSKEIWDKIDIETLLLIMEKPYQVTAEFAFDRIKDSYDPANPNMNIIKALIKSVADKAREQAMIWIDENKEFYFNDDDFLFSLMVSEYEDVREFITKANVKLSDDKNKIMIVKLIAYLMTQVKENKKAYDMSENLKLNYKEYLKDIGIDIIKDLLASPIEAIQEFGSFLFENHHIKVEDMPYELLQMMINSEFESVRGLGVKLIGKLPENTAILRIPLIISLATHQLLDIRVETRTLIEKLVIKQKNVGEKITEQLLLLLSEKESSQGVHEDIVFLLKNQLDPFTQNLDLEQIISLIKSRSKEAQELGGFLLSLDKNVKQARDLDLIEIVKLANHEILSVRESSWKIISCYAKKIIKDKEHLVKVMRFFDAKREDSRIYAREVFSKNFAPTDWTTELLIGLCDSIYPDVRKYGKEMIQSMFKSENAMEYLTKLSEHPSADMQLFATDYIESYINDDKDKIKELVPYFKRVLANVNRSRTAKNRILSFLSKQAKEDIENAKIINEIIHWYSGTNAVDDKAKAIEIMIEINKKYPELSTALKLNQMEVRNGI